MKHLEDEIEELEKLDDFRIRSAEMRDQGRIALREVTEGWHHSTNSVENAVIIKALCDRREGPPLSRIHQLEDLPANELFQDKLLTQPEEIPILRAARAMQALAAAPDSAFSEALLVYYYQIIREIYTADAPDWRVGGARAAVEGSASAYVTGECVRAILGFARTCDNTGIFIETIRSIREQREQLSSKEIPEEWRRLEIRRLLRNLYTSAARLLGNIAFKLDLPEDQDKLCPLQADYKSVEKFIDQAPARIKRAVANSATTFERVEKAIREFRESEDRAAQRADWEARERSSPESGVRRSAAKRRFERSETAHAVALGAIQIGWENAREASNFFSGNDPDAALGNLAKRFHLVAESVRRLNQPAKSFLSTVLDRELTAATSEARPGWDPAEMVFAATSFGFASRNFADDRLRRAGLCLSNELSERGRFPSGRPFYSDTGGKNIEVIGAEVLRAFAQLLANVDEVQIDNRLIKSMLLFFEDTQRRFPEAPQRFGWSLEKVHESSPPIRWVTALSVLALDHINRMLDQRINTEVFRHFSVKKGDDIKAPPLENLFYPDYGLRSNNYRPGGNESWEDEETVALTLERMRTHVFGLSHREKNLDPLFSLILYGPPGTGKTTLVEALAKSAGVPLVEITPSDIVSSGADVVERRARAVFQALSLLTRAVILFDEFDPVLKRRDPSASGPSTVFTFVTPGMLPKLKRLHETAKGRRVAYALVTNLIGTLDTAAIRSGRFDRKIGIYPPDPLSRAGRLVNEALSFKRRTHEELSNLVPRVLKLLQRTRWASIETLSRKGWFVSPKDSKSTPEGSPFSYLIEIAENKAEEELVKITPSQKGDDPQPPGTTKESQREWQQLTWIRNWDSKIGDEVSLEEVFEKRSSEVPQFTGQKTKPHQVYLTWGEAPAQGATLLPLYVAPGEGEESESEETPP